MDSWIETSSGNRISKQAHIYGSDHILISGNTTVSPNATLNGEVRLQEGERSSLQIGRFCFIDQNVQITPPVINHKSDTKIHKQCKIGSYTTIGSETIINASHIGTRVQIGANCKLGNQSKIHDCVIIKPNTQIPDNQIIPPFKLVQTIMNQHTGLPQLQMHELPESYKKIIETNSKLSYVNSQFTPSAIP